MLVVSGLSVGMILATSTIAAPAGAPILGRLISSSDARHLNFPSVANKPVSSTKTGSKKCPEAAQVVFENHKNVTGLIDQVFSCASRSAASTYLQALIGEYPITTSFSPPTALGSTAVGSATQAPVYAYMWRRGSYVAFVAVDTDATDNKDQEYSHRFDLLTKALVASLSKAAIEQNKKMA
jgi:hypothetical protein